MRGRCACPGPSHAFNQLAPVHSLKHAHKSSRRRLIVAPAAQDEHRSGWKLPWPFSKAADDESEYETVFVTDSAALDDENADQIAIREHDQHEPQLEHLQKQQHSAPIAPATATAAAATAAQHVPSDLATDADIENVQPASVHEIKAEAASSSLYVSGPQDTATPTTAAAAREQAVTEPTVPTADTLVSVPTSHPSSPALSAASPGGFWESSAGGWVVALSLLLAVRQGRLAADAGRLDVKALQARQHSSRVQSKELREKREQYLKEQAALKEAQAAKRLAESARRAEVARQEAAAKAAEYEKAAMEELEQLRAKRAAAKKAFEESQSRLAEELAERTAREVSLREEQIAKRQAEEAAARAAAEAEAARLAAAAQAAAEQAARAAREAAEQREAAKQQLRRDSIRIELQLHGASVAAATTNKQLQVSIELRPPSSSSTVGSSSKVYPSPEAAVDGATKLSAAAALSAVHRFSSAVAAATTSSNISDIGTSAQDQQQQVLQQLQQQIQQQQQQEGGNTLGRADLQLWSWLAQLKVAAAARQAICQVAPLAGNDELSQHFQVYVRYCGLSSHQSSALDQQLQQAARLVQQDQITAAANLLNDVIEWHTEDFVAKKPSDKVKFSSSSGSDTGSSTGSTLRPMFDQIIMAGGSNAALAYSVPACVYALLLNTADDATKALDKRASSSSGSGGDSSISAPHTPVDTDASDEEMFEALDADSSFQIAVNSSSSSSSNSSSRRRSIVSTSDSPLHRLVKHQLEQLTADAPQDSLAPVAALLHVLLGAHHPVAKAMGLLADRNTSMAVRQAREMRRQQQQLARATEVLKGSAVVGPSGLDPQGARMRQALVPVPERTWALRNVANSMLRSGAAASGDTAAAEEALTMLKQAADLAAEHYGKTHPGQLSTLLDYIAALLAVPGHEQDAAAAINAACSIVEAVGERYRQQHDLLSLVLLYESTQAELDVPGVLGRDDVLMRRLQRQAADAFSVLETSQANLVMSKRKIPAGSASTALRQLARDCTEDLAVYSSSKKRVTRLEQWNKNLPLAPLR